jgi:hypothetical protein
MEGGSLDQARSAMRQRATVRCNPLHLRPALRIRAALGRFAELPARGAKPATVAEMKISTNAAEVFCEAVIHSIGASYHHQKQDKLELLNHMLKKCSDSAERKFFCYTYASQKGLDRLSRGAHPIIPTLPRSWRGRALLGFVKASAEPRKNGWDITAGHLERFTVEVGQIGGHEALLPRPS